MVGQCPATYEEALEYYEVEYERRMVKATGKVLQVVQTVTGAATNLWQFNSVDWVKQNEWKLIDIGLIREQVPRWWRQMNVALLSNHSEPATIAFM